MIIVWFMILGAILLVAFILGAIGFLCTTNARGLLPGLLFGLPAVALSLPILVFCAGSGLLWLILFGGFATPPLFLGSSVICRDIQTGKKWPDFASGMLVCIGIFLIGFLLSEHRYVIDTIFFHLLPMPSIV